MHAGVDEAGRGPVLGPLVVAGVLVKDPSALSALGVADSKQLSPARRQALVPLIEEAATRVVRVVVEAHELNARMPRENLNAIEVDSFGRVLRALGEGLAVVDACDVDAKRFGTRVAKAAGWPDDRVVSRHQADATDPTVAAASIVAKVARDEHMEALSASVGEPCGSGYPSDPVTKAFLVRWVDKSGSLPPFARHEWETCKRLVRRDASLLDFPPSKP